MQGRSDSHFFRLTEFGIDALRLSSCLGGGAVVPEEISGAVEAEGLLIVVEYVPTNPALGEYTPTDRAVAEDIEALKAAGILRGSAIRVIHVLDDGNLMG